MYFIYGWRLLLFVGWFVCLFSCCKWLKRWISSFFLIFFFFFFFFFFSMWCERCVRVVRVVLPVVCQLLMLKRAWRQCRACTVTSCRRWWRHLRCLAACLFRTQLAMKPRSCLTDGRAKGRLGWMGWVTWPRVTWLPRCPPAPTPSPTHPHASPFTPKLWAGAAPHDVPHNEWLVFLLTRPSMPTPTPNPYPHHHHAPTPLYRTTSHSSPPPPPPPPPPLSTLPLHSSPFTHCSPRPTTES